MKPLENGFWPLTHSMDNGSWPLVRFIVPAFPDINIFSREAKKTTSLGMVNVATSASKLWGWRVEIIDENNYKGPRDENGMPDHHKLQREDFASVVGFYCGLSSTIERVFELAKLYRGWGVKTIAGGWHAHYSPKEMLENNIDIVAHGDGETTIRHILTNLQHFSDMDDVAGISFLKNGKQVDNPPPMLELVDLNKLPFPDFGLLRYGGKIKVYPISRIRGCAKNCEFCSVKGCPRWASAKHLFNTVKWLVETRKANFFFIVDDRLEENIEGTKSFFKMISEKYGSRLRFTVQIRLETAKDIEFVEIMKKAGVHTVAIGCESPIDEDLKAMRKGYTSKHMVEWAKILRRYFWVHGMFIFGYPHKDKVSNLCVTEMIKRFKKFIRRANLSSIQVLHPIPIIGSDLSKRLAKEGRLFPLSVVPWRLYDGSYVCFVPDNMSLAELQNAPIKIMKSFYSSFSFFKIPFKTISFPLHYLLRGWRHWYYSWIRDIVRSGGRLLILRWQKKQAINLFLEKLEREKSKLSK